MVDLLGGGQGALQVPLCFTEGAEGGVGVGAAGETEAQAGDVSGSFVAGDEPLIQAERFLRTVGQQKSVPDQSFRRGQDSVVVRQPSQFGRPLRRGQEGQRHTEVGRAGVRRRWQGIQRGQDASQALRHCAAPEVYLTQQGNVARLPFPVARRSILRGCALEGRECLVMVACRSQDRTQLQSYRCLVGLGGQVIESAPIVPGGSGVGVGRGCRVPCLLQIRRGLLLGATLSVVIC